MWDSFPEEHSEDAIAEAAKPYFRDKDGEPISKRTIKYWLRGDTLPSAVRDSPTIAPTTVVVLEMFDLC